MGKGTPLGSERLKTCELFAEILHLQYLYFSSPLFERLVFGTIDGEPAPLSSTAQESGDREADTSDQSLPRQTNKERAPRSNVADELVSVTEKFVHSKILPQCLV
jgi:hypothetical protein